MCPGGSVVAAASEDGALAVNGMSPFARDGENANAALLCEVRPTDFGSDHPLAGVELQRTWERAAFLAGGGDWRAPAQLMGDFLAERTSTAPGTVRPTYPLGVRYRSLEGCLPEFVLSSLREAVPMFARDATGQSNIRGLFPCGEGAGYAGGILSAGVDGIRQAENVLSRLRENV